MKFFKKETRGKSVGKVLVVEDDALLSRLFLDGLKREGIEALNVKDGLLALDSLDSFKPDLILLDMILPGLDGFEILKRLKSNSKWKNIPVFVVSNLDKIPDVKSAKVLEAEEYFIKAETKLEEIIQKVKKRLEK